MNAPQQDWEWTISVVGPLRRMRLRRGADHQVIETRDPAVIRQHILALCEKLEVPMGTKNEHSLEQVLAAKREELEKVVAERQQLDQRESKLLRDVGALEQCIAVMNGEAGAVSTLSRARRARGGAPAAPAGEKPGDRILAALAAGPLTMQELKDATGLSSTGIGVTCRHLQTAGKVRRDGDTVRLTKRGAA